MPEQTWSLTTAEFDFLWQGLNLGDYPFPMQVPSFGRTDRDRHAEAARIRHELRERGLFHVSALDPMLEQALRTVTTARLWLDSVWLAEPGHQSPHRVISARGPDGTTLLRQEPGPSANAGGPVRVTAIDDSRLVERLLAELPESPPGEHRPPPVPVEDLTTESAPDDPRDTSPAVSRTVRELVACRPRAGGQIGVNLRGDSGRRQRALAAHWFTRPDDGRYVAVMTQGADNRPWLTLAPADRTDLRRRVHHVIGELTALSTR